MHFTWCLLLFFIPEYGAVQLLLSVTKKVKLFEEDQTTNETTLASTHHAIAVDYHLYRGEVYFSDATGQIFRTQMHTHDNATKPTVIAEVKVCDGLAVDWVHDNLYWTDISRQTLEVATLDGLNRRILLNATNGLDKPRAITLDPSKGILFWSDWGEKAKVESSGLDGKSIKTIVSTQLAWPNGLTIDLHNSKLYILDGFLSSVSSCNYDGSDFKNLATSKEHFLQAFGLSFYSDNLYWNTWRQRTLYKATTMHLRTKVILQQTGLAGVTERMMGLKVVHATLQPKLPTRDPCKTATCSHSCLVSRDLTASCFCPFGYQLSSDNKTCSEKGYLLVSWGKTIRRYSLGEPEEEWLIDTTKSAVAVTYHLEKGLVYWSDNEEHRIYRAPLDQLNNKTVIAIPKTCDGLAVDWVHDVLYWTDTDRDTLEAAQLDGSKHIVLFNTDLDEPRDIAIDPFAGLIFWTGWGQNPRVERSTLDGLERRTISKNNVVWANGIAIDISEQKLFYVDGKLGTIYSSSYDGSDVNIIFSHSLSSGLQLFSITVLYDELFWTDWTTRGIYRSPKHSILVAQNIAKSSSVLVKPYGIRAVHSSLQKRKENPCAATRCRNLCLGTPTHTAHCMGEESAKVGIDTSNGTNTQPRSNHPELVKTAYNDSFTLSLGKPISPPHVLITVKCLRREGCEWDARCAQLRTTHAFTNDTSFRIAGLLPASHYEINFISAALVDTFNITTTLTSPPEIPTIESIEKEANKVIIKWKPVDTCIPGFRSYSYKLFKTSYLNDEPQVGTTNLTEVVFDNLEPEVGYTLHVYTDNPEHYSEITFNLHADATPECLDQDSLCNGVEDCPDGSDEDLKLCAEIQNVAVYMKSRSEVYFRVEVTYDTRKLLDKFVGDYMRESDSRVDQFEMSRSSCDMWPDSYCFHVSSLQYNTTYYFKISAVLKGGKVGSKYTFSATTKEEAPGPPEDMTVIKHNSTWLEYQWYRPTLSNGKIKSYLINIEEIETFENDKTSQPFPILEVPSSEEDFFHHTSTTGLTPATSYAVSILAKNSYVGVPATTIANTPPPPMKIIKTPMVEVASLLPLSWQPGDEPGELPQYHNLIRSYMLLLLPQKNRPINGTNNYDNDAIKELLKSEFGERFKVIWDKSVEDTAAFQSPIRVEQTTARNQYKLAWVQVSQYQDSYSIDAMVSDVFVAL